MAAFALTGCETEGNPDDPENPDNDTEYTLSVTATGSGGTVKATVGGQAVTKVKAGATVTLTATAAKGYIFDKWTVVAGGVTLSSTTIATATFTMPAANVTINATFDEIPAGSYVFSIIASPGVGAHITATIDGKTVTTQHTIVEEGATVSLTVTVEVGGTPFLGWVISSNALDDTDIPDIESPSISFSMPAADVAVWAEFEWEVPPVREYGISLEVAGNGVAVISIPGIGDFEANADCGFETRAYVGQTITLTATPSSGYEFKEWVIVTLDEDAGSPLTDATANPATFTMPAGAVEIKATFELLPCSITVTNDGNGTAQADKATAKPGETVTLTATPAEGYGLSKWTVVSGGVTIAEATSVTATFTMPSEDVSVKAEFAKIYGITVIGDSNGTGSASVNGSSATEAATGWIVTLSATPASGYVFLRWTVTSGGATLSDRWLSAATFTMPAGAVEIKAEFTTVATTSAEINGVTWAACNVNTFGTFATNPQDAGMFYQWNRSKAWSAAGSVSGWDKSTPSGDSWTTANDPCPDGWRVPTKEEHATLLVTAKVSNQWTTLNGVNGRTFTDKASGNTIFLPAAGVRSGGDGPLYDAGANGYYWSSTSHSADYAWGLYFNSGGALQNAYPRTCGFSVRCVKDE